MGKVVVAMSGGVDSSVAAGLLLEAGYDCVGTFMCLNHPDLPDGGGGRRCCSVTDAADARDTARKLGIPFYVLDFQRQFERIIEQFVDEYARGRTPNPCLLCNEHLKFGRLLQHADAVGADYVATGHHARVVERAGRIGLRRGLDRGKDQSYALFGIDRGVLRRVRLPIGELSKPRVRQHARRMGLAVHDKSESQEICFVPDDDYARLVRERRPEAARPGIVVDKGGRQLGTHEGIIHYTIGQRRGLGIAAGVPIYVTALDAAANTVTVGPREDLLKRHLVARRVNWLVDPPPDGPARVAAKIRYQHQAADATIEPTGESVVVTFDESQSAITPGQAVVFYEDDLVLGGGWIDEVSD